MVEKKMTSVEIVDKIPREKLREYWYELKQSRYDQHYYREMYDRILKMNPNLILPDGGETERIRKDALEVAFWEENWEISNARRVKNGGMDYTLFRMNGHGSKERSHALQQHERSMHDIKKQVSG